MPATNLGILNRATQKPRIVQVTVNNEDNTSDTIMSAVKNRMVNGVSFLLVVTSLVMSTIFLIGIV